MPSILNYRVSLCFENRKRVMKGSEKRVREKRRKWGDLGERMGRSNSEEGMLGSL